MEQYIQENIDQQFSVDKEVSAQIPSKVSDNSPMKAQQAVTGVYIVVAKMNQQQKCKKKNARKQKVGDAASSFHENDGVEEAGSFPI